MISKVTTPPEQWPLASPGNYAEELPSSKPVELGALIASRLVAEPVFGEALGNPGLDRFGARVCEKSLLGKIALS